MNMALLHQTQEQFEEAESLYRKSLAITEKALGRDSFSLISPLTNYASLLRQLQRNEEADALEARVKALQEKQAAKAKTS